jgi:hypothetical protein
MPCVPLARSGRSADPAEMAAVKQLIPILSSKSELFCTLLRANSLPCHSYEYMGGRGSEIPLLRDRRLRSWRSGGYPPRVHIPLNLQHLAFPPLASEVRLGSPRSSNSLSAITYEVTFPQVLTRHHIRFSPQSKSLRAFTYDNRGVGPRYQPGNHTTVTSSNTGYAANHGSAGGKP